MLKWFTLVARSLVLVGLAAAAAVAQTPIFSLEVVAINSMPLKETKTEIVAARGDILTTEIYLRDWSPEAEVLRSFQATIDQSGFTSGSAGSIKPVDFDNTSATGVKNPDNCFVDAADPRFVHANLYTIPIADSVSYRLVSVLLDSEESPLCYQDGTKFYAGTLRLQVSDDAEGVFTLGLDEDPSSSGLRDPMNKPIEPLDFEPLIVHVADDSAVLRIQASDPPSNSIDARQLVSRIPETASDPDTITLTLSGDTAGISALDFLVEDSTDDPPAITALHTDGASVTLVLDHPLAVGAWTIFTHEDSQTFVQIACLPGDVDNSGAVAAGDLLTLINGLNKGQELALYQADINRNGRLEATDALRLIDLLTDPELFRGRLD
jgi:hypothetical protein